MKLSQAKYFSQLTIFSNNLSDPHVAHKDPHVDHSDPHMDQYDPHMDHMIHTRLKIGQNQQ